MKKRIELSDHKVSVQGTPDNRGWLERIKEAGGRTTNKVSITTTLLIHGERYTKQRGIARGSG